MSKRVTVIFLSLVVLFSFGCSNSDESVTVAKNFWKAMEDRDLERAKSYATKATANSLNINEENKDQEVEIIFGEVTKEDGKTMVTTTMRTTQDENTMDIAMKTVLVKEEGEWKVDVDQTMMSLFGGAMGAMMESMKEGMEEMGKAMADEMKAGFEEMGNDLSSDDGN
jgi:hypothetical protein